MSEIARPKPGEEEEDLLRQQNEFFEKSVKPSVQVVNKRQPDKRTSKFAKSKRKKTENDSAINSCILGDVKEKEPDFNNWKMLQSGSQKGFPEAFSTENIQHTESTSVFSKHILQQKGEPASNNPVSPESEKISNIIGSKSFILSGPNSCQIHQENMEIISKMSAEEISAQQEILNSSLDPNLLAFVRSKRETKTESSSELQMEVDKPVASCSKASSSLEVAEHQTKVKEEVLSFLPCNEDQTWLHMDIVENEKFMWMGEIPSVRPINPDQPYTARFDFQGLLLPYASKNIDVRDGLYNHGNEPERPGYSLEELFQLSRSTVQQQRIIATSIMSNILEKSKRGYYDECFNSGLITLLLDHDIFLLLRYALDDNTEALLVQSLSAMKNLLCSEVDELCLDRALGCPGFLCQPFLTVEEQSASKDDDLKVNEGELQDYQILKLDVVKGALRTDIIPRIRYILEVLQPCPNAVLSCLQILIRLARHSFDSMKTIIQCPHLMDTIIKNFIPKNWSTVVGTQASAMQSVYNVPLVEALKLCRILSSSPLFLFDLIHKYHIMDPVMNYISIDPRECSLPLQEVLRLTLDSFYIWQGFLVHDLAVQHFIDMHPVLIRLLQFQFACTSVDDDGSPFSHEHGTALITLIEQAIHVTHHEKSSKKTEPTLEYYHIKDFCDIIHLCLTKWLSQLGKATTFTFSAMKLVGAAFNCLATLYTCHLPEMNKANWPHEMEMFLSSVVLLFLRSSGFQEATADMKTFSCLLFMGELGTNRDPLPLPSLGALMWRGSSLTPVLQEKSPVPLVYGLVNFLQTIYGAPKISDVKCLQLLLSNSSLSEYVERINAEDISHMASHWFTRLEINMFALFCKLIHTKKCYSSSFHCLAFKLVSTIQRYDINTLADLMGNVIFNPEFFSDASVCDDIAVLQISDIVSDGVSKSEISRIALKDLPLIWDCYKNCLQLNNLPPKNSMMEINAVGKPGEKLVLSADWPYLPIITLYREEKAFQPGNDATVQLVCRNLKWLILLDELRPNVFSISVTERFCNLSKIFLSGSDLFLDPSVHKLLSCIFNSTMERYREIKFPPSFYYLYTQLLEQFAAVSYGDSLFGQFLLVPLQQRHSCETRKQMWSEHAAVLRILSTPVSELMFPLSEMLEPCETDYSLLQNYLQCLATGMVRENWCPVLYKVALHHVSTFLKLFGNTAFAEQLRANVNRMGNQELQLLLRNSGRE